nr:hypothetical protein [Actinomycetota bacterium]
MADEPVQPENGERHVSPGDGPVGTPRWVKISGIVAAIVIALIVVVLLFGGDHGPGRHTAPMGGAG